MSIEIRNPRTGQRLILTPSPAATLAANARQKAALKAKADAAKKLADEIQAEHKARADEEARGVRAHIRATIAREAPEEVDEADQGPVTLLARDGLNWLVKRKTKPLTMAQRMAGEEYRKHYLALYAAGGRSCIGEAPSGNANTHGGDTLPPLRNAAAREQLDRARVKGLAGDGALIWLVDEVCGKGSTLRDLAKGDQKTAESLEAELKVALRLLARHWGFAS